MKLTKNKRRNRIKNRIRKVISGTKENPRLSVFRSNKEIYAQLVDDVTGSILASSSSMEKEFSKSKLDQKQKINPKELDEKDIRLLNSLMKFEIYFKQAINNNEPHFLADYLYEISNEYNSIYQDEKILQNKSNVKMINKIIITKYFVEYSLLLMESLGIFPVDEM